MQEKMTKTNIIILLFVLLLGLFINLPTSMASEHVRLYTPYSNISVTPGETINYNVEISNQGSSIENVSLDVSGLSPEWNYELTSGGYKVNQISVQPGDQQNVSLRVEVPLEIDQGSYSFSLRTNQGAALPLTIQITEQGVFQTEFSADQPNLEGHSDSTFSYRTEINNKTAQEQMYALSADAPPGWTVTFEVDAKRVSSVNVEAGKTKNLTIDVDPPEQVKAGTYTIPVYAASSEKTSELELETVISGSYSIDLSTPDGLLSTETTSGKEKKLDLTVTNTGSVRLDNITLNAETPVNWDVTFEPQTIEAIEPGETASIKAIMTSDSNAISGDYVVNMKASTPETRSEAIFRVTVKTSLLWGWFGILIIIGVIAGLATLLRKYGRR